MTRVILFLALAATSYAAADTGLPDGFVDQFRPLYPQSELSRGREGWVLISYSVDVDGSIINQKVEDSSGSKAFDETALEATKTWHDAPLSMASGKTVLVNFVFETSKPSMTRSFSRRYIKINQYIDKGRLDRAEKMIADLGERRLYPTEVAYRWIAKARIAEHHGDRQEQLRCFRKAMISGGQWVTERDYLDLLRATVVLGLQTGDYISAIRDYGILMQSGPGRKRAADLADAINQASDLVDNGLPFAEAQSLVVITHENPRPPYGMGLDDMPRPMEDEPQSRPPPSEPPEETQAAR